MTKIGMLENDMKPRQLWFFNTYPNIGIELAKLVGEDGVHHGNFRFIGGVDGVHSMYSFFIKLTKCYIE